MFICFQLCCSTRRESNRHLVKVGLQEPRIQQSEPGQHHELAAVPVFAGGALDYWLNARARGLTSNRSFDEFIAARQQRNPGRPPNLNTTCCRDRVVVVVVHLLAPGEEYGD